MIAVGFGSASDKRYLLGLFHLSSPMNEDLLRVLNDSGFPLQVAVQRAIDEKTQEHGWQVRYTEHAWKAHDQQRSGFIDLVVGDRVGAVYIALECKRVRDADWIFLHTDGNASNRRHAQAWLSQFDQGHFRQFGWSHLQVEPTCPEVQFCAIRGQSSNDKTNLLERSAAELVHSTEALAPEHRDIRRADTTDVKVFVSVIVTTAKLKVAKFDVVRISLADGTVDEAQFDEVPYVRFRKQLGAIHIDAIPINRRLSGDLSYLKESTVFVVNAQAVNDFLGGLHTHGAGLGSNPNVA